MRDSHISRSNRRADRASIDGTAFAMLLTDAFTIRVDMLG